jgi:predicted RNA-binding protein with PUA-like domain
MYLALKNCLKKTEPWDDVRNYQARNMMRVDIKKGDLAFFYHSNCKQPGMQELCKQFAKAILITQHSIQNKNILTRKVIPTIHVGTWLMCAMTAH